MAFNLKPSQGDGDFMPYVKYNAKAGRWYYRVETGKDANGNSLHQELEIVNPTFYFDMANIKTGWIAYASGAAPIKFADPGPGDMAAKPAGVGFKRGFWVSVWNQQTGVREFSSNAASVIGPICEMYSQWEAESRSRPGQAMVCQCVRVVPVKGKKDTNYAPVFQLQGWQACPHFSQQAPVNQGPPVHQPAPQDQSLEPGTRAWGKFSEQKKATGMQGPQIALAWKQAFEEYFGCSYNPKYPNALQWAEFVKDNFQCLPPVPLDPPGTAMPADEIPF